MYVSSSATLSYHLDTSHPSVLISVKPQSERMSRVSSGLWRYCSERRPHTGVCAEPEWWKDQAGKWNFSELCITAQCHWAFCGFHRHTCNDSLWQYRSTGWQHPLLLKEGWAASLTVSYWAAVNCEFYFYKHPGLGSQSKHVTPNITRFSPVTLLLKS